MTTPAEDVIRKGHAAFNEGDVDALREVIAEDVRWHVPGDNPLAGTYEGADAVIEQVMRPMLGSITIHDEGYLTVGDVVVVLNTATARTPEGERTAVAVEVARVADGKVTERWAIQKGQAEIDEMISAMAQGG